MSPSVHLHLSCRLYWHMKSDPHSSLSHYLFELVKSNLKYIIQDIVVQPAPNSYFKRWETVEFAANKWWFFTSKFK